MTSKLVVNTIEADTGISSVSFASSISMSSTSVFHFSDAGVNIGADTNISRLGNGILGFNINGSEKVRITSAGKVGINSTSPTSTLDVVGGYQALGLYRNDFTGNSGAGIELYFGRAKADGSLFNCAIVSAVGSDNTGQASELRFSVLTSGSMSEKVRIDSSGHLMIGNTNASTQYADSRDLVIGNTSGSHGMTIISQSNNVGRIMWSDTYTSGTGTYEGQILYSHADEMLHFYANYTSNSNVAMQLGGSQNQLFVGIDKGSTTTHDNRSAFFHRTTGNSNYISITTGASGACGIVFGDSIATGGANYETYIMHENSTNDLWFRANQGSDDRHLKLKSTGNVEIGNGNLVLANGHGIDFSADGNVGGMTGELLDDYETGTWIPDVVGSSGSDTWSYRREGRYTKIGNKVTASWSLGQYNGNLSGGVYINNLPFTVSFRQYGGDIGFYDINPPANTCGYFIYLESSNTNAKPYFTINGGAGVQCTASHFYAGNRTFWEGNVTYYTTS